MEQPNDLTAIFTINPKAVWQDIEPTNGREVNAYDILYTYGDPYQEYPNRAILLPHLDSGEAVDKDYDMAVNGNPSPVHISSPVDLL